MSYPKDTDNKVTLAPGEEMTTTEFRIAKGNFTNDAPKISIYRWKPVAIDKKGRRLYARVADEFPTWIPVTSAEEMIEVPIRKDTLRRLAFGDFIRSTRPSPGLLLISVESLYDHLDRMEREPFFWAQPLNAQRWAESRNMTGYVDRSNKDKKQK